MLLISKFNKGIPFLLCVTDISNKYGWVIPLKDKKSITISNAFQKFQMSLNANQTKKQVDKASKFYYRSMKSWLQNSNIEMYSTHNEEKPVAAERCI